MSFLVARAACMLSCFSPVQLFATLWSVACQAPLSTGFSRQEYWSELPSPSPGHLPYRGIESVSLVSPALAGRFFITSATREAHVCVCFLLEASLNLRKSTTPWWKKKILDFGTRKIWVHTLALGWEKCIHQLQVVWICASKFWPSVY